MNKSKEKIYKNLKVSKVPFILLIIFYMVLTIFIYQKQGNSVSIILFSLVVLLSIFSLVDIYKFRLAMKLDKQYSYLQMKIFQSMMSNDGKVPERYREEFSKLEEYRKVNYGFLKEYRDLLEIESESIRNLLDEKK